MEWAWLQGHFHRSKPWFLVAICFSGTSFIEKTYHNTNFSNVVGLAKVDEINKRLSSKKKMSVQDLDFFLVPDLNVE